MRKFNLLAGIMVLAAFVGCSSDIAGPETTLVQTSESAAKAQLGGMIWADGELFGTVGTPTDFKPDSGPFDVLYTGGGFKDGVGSISESKPGDQDFNGGRWEVWQLKEDVTTDYSNADSVYDLNIDDFEKTGTYFECPLLPRRGSRHNR